MGKAPPVGFFTGLLVCLALAGASIFIARLPALESSLHVSPLLVVIILGIAVAAVLRLSEALQPGIVFVQKVVLRWAVAGLGFKLSLQELLRIGGPSLVVVTVSTVAALWFGYWSAKKLGLTEKMSILLAVGGGICGASAVVAADSVVQSERRDSAVALGVITLLGTIGILLYPLIGKAFGLSEFLYGVWDGASLHEMAQVVAAGHGFSPEAADVATVAKLARICLLAPVVFYLAWSLRHANREAGKAKVQIVPWFLIAFLVFVVINSTSVLSKQTVKLLTEIDLWLLCIGMAAVGLQTRLEDLKQAGVKPILAGTVQWVFLATLSLGLAVLLCR